MIQPLEIPYDEALFQKLRRFCFAFESTEKTLKVHPIDLLYMVKKNSATYDLKKLETLLEKDPLGMHAYSLARHLRDHGYPVRLSLDSQEKSDAHFLLRVGRKGYRPDEDRTDTLMFLVENPKECDIQQFLDISRRLRKTAVITFFVDKKPLFWKISQTTFD